MGRFSLAKSLAFAAFSALGIIPCLIIWGPELSRAWIVGVYASAIVISYLMVIAPGLRRAAKAGLLGTGLVMVALLLGSVVGSPWGTLLVASFCLGVVRSGFLFRRSAIRALTVEGLLIITGWGMVLLVAHGSMIGVALGFWVFFLVQSLFALLGDSADVSREKKVGDPFEAARAGAFAVMGDQVT